MAMDIGLEIALHGAMTNVRAGITAQDAPMILASTRRLQDLFAEADRRAMPGVQQIAQQARDMIDAALAQMGSAAAGAGAPAPMGAHAAYRSIDGLPR